MHKQNFKKSNLKIDGNTTESVYMKANGALRIWNCGKLKFRKTFSDLSEL